MDETQMKDGVLMILHVDVRFVLKHGVANNQSILSVDRMISRLISRQRTDAVFA